MRGLKETRPCAACGTEITRLVSQARGNRWYCDHACQMTQRPLGASAGKAPNPLRGQKDTRPCANCGKPVTRYLSIQKQQAAFWACSVTCKAQYDMRQRVASGSWKQPVKPRTGDTIPCATCGKGFYRQPAYIKQGRKYCSRECHAIGQTKGIPRPCAYCGKMMQRSPSQAAIKYCTHQCRARAQAKRPTGREHNGRPVLMNHQGYLTVYEPTSPMASRTGRVLEHRWVVSQRLDRPLTSAEQVDHINQDKTDNRDENLQVLDATTHTRKTAADRVRKERAAIAKIAELEAELAKLRAEVSA